MAQESSSSTLDRIHAAAEAEFLEKGYQGASLRSICKKAGVTTGALYFFFKDKDDIFASLVAPVLGSICTMMEAHMQQELQEVKGELQEGQDDFSDDVYASRRIIHELYQNYDRVQLLLTKSQGSSLAGCIDEFVAFTEKNYRMLADAQAKVCGVSAPDDYTIHWMAHMQIDAFVHLLTHEPDEEKAVAHLGDILKYLLAGWYALFQKDE